MDVQGRRDLRLRLTWAFVGVAAYFAVHSFHRGVRAPAPARPSAAVSPHEASRPTSVPYAGDLNVFESPGRDKRLQIDRVMTLLKMAKGTSVADLGAGSGWFTVRAARRVGSKGTVFAEDINPKAMEYIDARAAKEKLGNIRTVLGTPDDPKLPPASVDAVLMLKMYHEVAQPVAFVQRLKPALKPGALVGIIDRNGNGSGTDHGIPQRVVEREMEEAGFREVDEYDFTKGDGEDYFLIFTAK